MEDTPQKPGRIIRASEIGQYEYCARAWWLGNVKGVPSSNTREMARGEEAHQQHGRAVWLAGALKVLALLLALAALALLVLAIVRP